MSDSTLDDNDLTPTQEYLIAGIVILLFGSLYWFFNHGSPNFETPSSSAYPPVPVISESSQSRLGSGDTTKPIPLSAMESEGNTAQSVQSQSTQDQTDPVADQPTPQTQVAETKNTRENTDESVPVSTAQTEDSNAGLAGVTDESATIKAQQADASEQASTTADASEQANTTSATVQGHTSDNTNSDDAPVQQAETPASEENAGSPVVMDTTVSKLNDDLLNGIFENPLVLKSISFSSNSTEIKLDSDQQIKDIAGLLQKHPDSKVLIRGHTDAEGIPANNKRLSLMRATAMGRKLVDAGASVQSIIIMGMGDTEPLTSNDSEAGRRQNRRIDISITQ